MISYLRYHLYSKNGFCINNILFGTVGKRFLRLQSCCWLTLHKMMQAPLKHDRTHTSAMISVATSVQWSSCHQNILNDPPSSSYPRVLISIEGIVKWKIH